MNNDARGLLIQAEQARERGDFRKSLELLADAIVVIQEERKEEKLADALSSQALCYRHLFDKTNSKNFLTLAKHSAVAAVELAKQGGDSGLVSVATYNLGKVQESLGSDEEALTSYKEAVNQESNRQAMKAEMKTRLATLEYKNGDKEALERFENSLKELIESEDKDNYSKSVWVSGAYMHMAKVLIGKDDEKARELLSEAKKVIDSDMRLKLRREQLDQMMEQLAPHS